MRQEELLKDKYGKDPGFRVPEGYFEELNSQIISSLPDYSETPRFVEMSKWQRVKPYLYLAAMFCGIWLMMKVFHSVSSDGRLTLDNPPEAIVQIIEEENFDPYTLYSSEPEYYLEEEVSANYDSIDEFEQDFGYTFKPEYSSLAPLSEGKGTTTKKT